MDDEMQEERAPLLRKWGYWYLLVIGFLLLEIVVFYFLTKQFS
jgi:hypothetical protein